ncbi:MAG: hypothetical protein KatS3mg035_1053 [Bacteroidia bacterium]|nr:MAG: hypothetical protein KatS3mg035_1053 [Bacteroidia bacterium]
MKTKKITLNELRNLVKQIIKKECYKGLELLHKMSCQTEFHLSSVMCCVCGSELTIKENEENLTYDVKERICDKCNNELSEEIKNYI